MTLQCSRYEASSFEIGQDKWIEYAPSFVKSLGLTLESEINTVNGMASTVRAEEQRIEFLLVEAEHKTNISVTYSLKPNTNKISLAYCKDRIAK